MTLGAGGCCGNGPERLRDLGCTTHNALRTRFAAWSVSKKINIRVLLFQGRIILGWVAWD